MSLRIPKTRLRTAGLQTGFMCMLRSRLLHLLLERMTEQARWDGDTWRTTPNGLSLIPVAQLLGGGKTVWEVTIAPQEPRYPLRILNLDGPAPNLRVD